MNTFLQIAVGLAPIEIFLIIWAIIRKKPRIPQLVSLALVGICIVTSVVMSFQKDAPAEDKVILEKEAVRQLDVIYTVGSKAGNEAYASALLKQLRQEATDSGKITLCDAYLRGAQGDWQGAWVLYQKAQQMGEKEDKPFATACENAMHYAQSVLAGTQQGSEDGIEQLKTLSREMLSDYSVGAATEAGQTAALLVESKALFDTYLQTRTLDKEQAKKLSSSMSKLIEENDTLLRMQEVRNCRTKLHALCGYYSAIAGNIDTNSTYSELAIAAELYLNGLVTNSDFRDDFVSGYKDMAEAVVVQLRVVLKDVSDTETGDRINALIDELSATDPSALQILQDAIYGIAADEKDVNKPKAHIQLAKIAHYNKDNVQAKSQISAALGSAGVSRDEAFYTPLQKLAGVVNNNDNSEELKNVSGYVAEVLDNTSDPIVVAVIEDIRAQKEETQSQETQPQEDETPAFGSGTVVETMPPQTEITETGKAPENNSTATSYADTFATFMGDTVNQLSISVDITAVDALNFPKVVATVNVDGDMAATAEELKSMIKVTDCGMEITDFTVEKVEVAKAQILLCCDISISMDGQPLEDLKKAVRLFVETASDKEDLAIVTFGSYVDSVLGFGTPRQELMDKADSLRVVSGTNMYNAVIESLEKFSEDFTGPMYIILLSDGTDNNARTDSEIKTNIGYPAMDKGVIVYSIGIGSSVNTQYLGTIADVTGGKRVHAQDSASLQTFYDSIRNQMLNQYIITFEAKDTLRADRDLKISMIGDSVVEDTASYYLEQAGEGSSQVDSIISFGKKGVSHLSTGKILKSDCDTVVKIHGFGFEKDDSVSVELDGKQNYDSSVISCKYVDENTLEMTVPGGVACDKYNVKISIGLMSTTIKNGLIVINQDMIKTTEHGPYRFTSFERTEVNGVITLSGEVTLNEWLVFKGDVTLQKSDSDVREMTMTDHDGAYVTFNPNLAKGLAGLMAKAEKRLYILPLGSVVLINEITANPSDQNYPVNKIAIPAFHLGGVATINAPGVALYPYKLSIESDAFTTELPMQDKILSAAGADLFDLNYAIGGSVSPQSIDVKAEVKYEDDPLEDIIKGYKSSNMGCVPIYVAPSEAEVLIDTAANEYKLEFMVKVSFIEGDGIGLRLKWKGRDNDKGAQLLIPSEVVLKAGVEIPGQIGPVPVTYSNFEVGLSDIDPNENILKWKLVGGFDLSTGTLSDLIPGLEEIFEDPAMLTLNPSVELSLGQGYFKLAATLKLLETIELANATIEAGKIPVNSVLLGFDNEAAIGMRGEVGVGLNWEIPNCKVDIGSSAAIHLHNKFLGIEVSGDGTVEIGWSIFRATMNEHGTVAVGFQRIDDLPTFVLKVMVSDRSSSEGYYLIWNKETNMKIGKLEV